MEHPVEGIVKVQGEGNGSAPAAGAPAAPGRPASAPAPEAPRDTVDISAAAQAASEATARALKAQEQARNSGGASSPEPSPIEALAPNISFNYNKEVGILQAAVVDPTTHKVIRQIPPDEVLKMGVRFRNIVKEQADAAQRVSSALGFDGDTSGESDLGGEKGA